MIAGERLLVISVGTSLFHSASWDPDRVPADEVPGYPALARETSPEERQTRRDVTTRIETALRPDNATVWSQRLRAELLRGERVPGGRSTLYSAELTTLLRLAAAEGTTPRDLLRGAAGVHVVADDQPNRGERGRSWTAAVHLVEVLDDDAGRPGTAQLLRIPGLASREPRLLLGTGSEPTGLRLLVAEIEELAAGHRGATLDLVVTGGFKLYGYALAALAVQRTDFESRLLYGHESAELVVMDRRRISLDGVGIAWPATPPGLALGGCGDAP